MKINLNNLEMLTILHGLEALHDNTKEYRELAYDNNQDFLIDLNKIRNLHNNLLVQAKNEAL